MKVEIFLLILIFSIFIKASIEFELEPSFLISEEKNFYAVKVGDINGDGLLDLIFSGYGEKLEVYLNSINGLSPLPSFYSNEIQSAFDISLADIDRNGYLDAIVANYVDPLRIYFNINGNLENSPSWESEDSFNVTSLAVLNTSNDGFLDIVTGGFYVPVKIYENKNGNLPKNATWSSPEKDLAIVSVKAEDLDKDGFMDIVVASDGGPIRVYKNNGGSFSNYTWQSPVSLDSQYLILCDVNSDGFPDAIVSQWNNSFVIFKNINGNFENYPSYFSYNSGFYEGISCGDVDLDGFTEIFISNDSFKVEGYENTNGNVSRFPAYETLKDAHNWQISLGDINFDNKLDFCVARRFQKSACFYNLSNYSENPPSKPEININVMGQNVTFEILSYDDYTPQEALSYFLRVGSGSGLRDVVFSPLSTTDLTSEYGYFHRNLINLNFPDGIYYASAQAIDLAYKRSQWSDEKIFIVDITPPSSQFSYPQNNQSIETCGKINITGIANDNVSGIESVEFSPDGINYYLADGKENWQYLWNVPSAGYYNLFSRAKDNLGNIESPPNTITVYISIDETPPENVSNSLILNKISEDILDLFWADRSSSGATGYNIYKGFEPDFMHSNPGVYSTSDNNNFRDENALEPLIFYNVKAFDICGNESED